MSTGEPLTYRDAGVDLDAAAAAKRQIRELVDATRTEAVRAGFGSFGGRLAFGGDELVASADGVGTKLEVAFRADRHDTVGEDLVNHCVYDILAEGATPVAFLDYFACGSLDEEVALGVVRGVARGCRLNGCALLGGETAEMPGFYPPGKYDLAGFIIGRSEYPEVARRELEEGDVLLGLESNGLHTNGYSLAREVLFERLGLSVHDTWPGLDAPVGEILLKVHRSYLEPIRSACERSLVKALAHITGGGIPGNLSRILPVHLDAAVDVRSWSPPPEFLSLANHSGARAAEMYRVFNMGIGMVVVTTDAAAGDVESGARESGCAVHRIGDLRAGSGEVRLDGLSEGP